MKAKLLLKLIESNYELATFVKDFGEVANKRGIDLIYDGSKDEFVLVRKGKELGRVKFEKDLVKATVDGETEVFRGQGKELIDQILRFISRRSL